MSGKPKGFSPIRRKRNEGAERNVVIPAAAPPELQRVITQVIVYLEDQLARRHRGIRHTQLKWPIPAEALEAVEKDILAKRNYKFMKEESKYYSYYIVQRNQYLQEAILKRRQAARSQQAREASLTRKREAARKRRAEARTEALASNLANLLRKRGSVSNPSTPKTPQVTQTPRATISRSRLQMRDGARQSRRRNSASPSKRRSRDLNISRRSSLRQSARSASPSSRNHSRQSSRRPSVNPMRGIRVGQQVMCYRSAQAAKLLSASKATFCFKARKPDHIVVQFDGAERGSVVPITWLVRRVTRRTKLVRKPLPTGVPLDWPPFPGDQVISHYYPSSGLSGQSKRPASAVVTSGDRWPKIQVRFQQSEESESQTVPREWVKLLGWASATPSAIGTLLSGDRVRFIRSREDNHLVSIETRRGRIRDGTLVNSSHTAEGKFWRVRYRSANGAELKAKYVYEGDIILVYEGLPWRLLALVLGYAFYWDDIKGRADMHAIKASDGDDALLSRTFIRDILFTCPVGQNGGPARVPFQQDWAPLQGDRVHAHYIDVDISSSEGEPKSPIALPATFVCEANARSPTFRVRFDDKRRGDQDLPANWVELRGSDISGFSDSGSISSWSESDLVKDPTDDQQVWSRELKNMRKGDTVRFADPEYGGMVQGTLEQSRVYSGEKYRGDPIWRVSSGYGRKRRVMWLHQDDIKEYLLKTSPRMLSNRLMATVLSFAFYRHELSGDEYCNALSAGNASQFMRVAGIEVEGAQETGANGYYMEPKGKVPKFWKRKKKPKIQTDENGQIVYDSHKRPKHKMAPGGRPLFEYEENGDVIWENKPGRDLDSWKMHPHTRGYPWYLKDDGSYIHYYNGWRLSNKRDELLYFVAPPLAHPTDYGKQSVDFHPPTVAQTSSTLVPACDWARHSLPGQVQTVECQATFRILQAVGDEPWMPRQPSPEPRKPQSVSLKRSRGRNSVGRSRKARIRAQGRPPAAPTSSRRKGSREFRRGSRTNSRKQGKSLTPRLTTKLGGSPGDGTAV